MISVVIPTFNDEARLAACLAPLVPASMEGLIKQLVIVDRGSTDETLEIADDAGALIVHSADIADGIGAAKHPWLLILDPRVRLDYGWEAAARRHIETSKKMARFKLEKAGTDWLGSIAKPKVAAVLTLQSGAGRLRLAQGAQGLLVASQGLRLGARGTVDP